MKALILAAGVGTRMKPLTDSVPKGLLKIGNKAILQHQIDALNCFGVKDISIIVGHLAEKVKSEIGGKARYYLNESFAATNMLESIYCAKKELNGALIMMYADIVFEKKLIEKMLQNSNDFALAVDMQKTISFEEEDFFETYHGKKIPKGVTKVCIENGLIKEISKSLPKEKSMGEFIGVSKFSKKGTQKLRKAIEELIASGEIGNYPSPSYLFQKLINEGNSFYPVFMDGIKYDEIDYPADLERVIKSKFFD